MIIRSLAIERFGIFAAQEPVQLGAGLNIFLGENEAGKSTLLKFFRAMFFGYKRDGKNVYDYSLGGKNSAASGGSLFLQNSQGANFSLTRRPGAHGGLLSLADATGRALPASFLDGLLGNQTDKMYDQVFCFGHKDLSELEGMKDERVAGALHAAAFGSGFKSPLEISRSLRAEQDKIFGPRASTRPLNQALAKLAAVQADLNLAGSELSRYNSLQTERERLEAGQAEAQIALRALGQELAAVRSLSAAWADWSALQETRAELVLNPHPGGQFGVELGHFNDIVDALLRYRSEHKGKEELLERGRTELRQGAEHAALAAVWPDCQNLLARKSSVQDALVALPRLEAFLLESRSQQEKKARSLGTGWTLARALEFEFTLALHNGIDFGRQNIESATRALEQAERELSRLRGEAREAQEELKALRQGQALALTPDGEAQDALSALRHNHTSDPLSGREVEAGEAGAAITLALYTPEARLRVEAAGRGLEESRKTARDQDLRLQELLTAEAAELENLEAGRAELQAARSASQAALTAAAQKKATLFRLATARQDTRRVPWLLLCLALAVLCLSGAYKYFSATALAYPDSWAKFTSLAAWKTYLQGDWLSFAFALAFIWGALYWLNPRIATFGRWRPAEPEYAATPAARAAQSRCDALSGQLLAQEAQLERSRAALATARAAAEQAEQARRRAEELWKGCVLTYALPAASLPDEALKICDAAVAAAQCARKEQGAVETLALARNGLEAVRAEWRRWLEGAGFAPEFTPQNITGVLERLKDIQTQAEQAALRETELADKRTEIQSFRASLAAIMQEAGWKASDKGGSGDNEPLAVFDALYNAAFAAHQKITALDQQAVELKKLEADLARLNAALGAQEARFRELLKQGEAGGEADYRLRFQRHASHQALRRKEELLSSRLAQAAEQAQADSGERLWASSAEFTNALGSSAAEALEQRGLDLKERQRALQSEVSQRHERQGEIRVLLENLRSGQGGADLQTRETALREELKKLVRDWVVLALAGNFISQARHSFEEERHDSVIRQAGEILGELTGGRYRQLLFDLGAKEFKAYAVSVGGEQLDSETALSQGTREQLYLALRLAFIRQHNLSKESLPLILDDILVNFDPARARKAASIFSDFSGENQELFFTCHPSTADLLRALAPQARLFKIKSGKIIPDKSTCFQE